MNDPINIQVKAIAANIKRIRLIRNYKQSYMAGRLNISQNAYSKIELGYSSITINKLLQIAHILGVSVIEIIGTDLSAPDFFQPSQQQVEN